MCVVLQIRFQRFWVEGFYSFASLMLALTFPFPGRRYLCPLCFRRVRVDRWLQTSCRACSCGLRLQYQYHCNNHYHHHHQHRQQRQQRQHRHQQLDHDDGYHHPYCPGDFLLMCVL